MLKTENRLKGRRRQKGRERGKIEGEQRWTSEKERWKEHTNYCFRWKRTNESTSYSLIRSYTPGLGVPQLQHLTEVAHKTSLHLLEWGDLSLIYIDPIHWVKIWSWGEVIPVTERGMTEMTSGQCELIMVIKWDLIHVTSGEVIQAWLKWPQDIFRTNQHHRKTDLYSFFLKKMTQM